MVATCLTVVFLLLFDFLFQVKSCENIGRMMRGGRASRESLIRLCFATCKWEYEWNILQATHANTLIVILSYLENGQ